MDHQDLRRLLDAIVRSAKHSHERLGVLIPFGMTLSDEGQISKLSSPRAQQTLEDGLSLLAQHGDCKAIGFCSDTKSEINIFVEHRDRSAFRVSLPRVNGDFHNLQSSQLKLLRAEPKFFVTANRKSFLASSNSRW